MSELKDWIDYLNNVRTAAGCKFVAVRDRANNYAAIKIVYNDGLLKFETVNVVFKLDETDTPPEKVAEKIMERLLKEYLACMEASFRKTFMPGSYVDDASPVKVVEEISLEGVIRI